MSVEELADRHLPGGDYTIERREFQDGDRRDTAIYAVGLGETGDRYEYRLWKQSRKIWVEYYEGDILRQRDVFPIDLQERVI